jgi:branched-subunit amino acid transport protein
MSQPSARPERRRNDPSFLRRIITTVPMVVLAALIVRDILARRWGTERQPQSDVTQRSR